MKRKHIVYIVEVFQQMSHDEYDECENTIGHTNMYCMKPTKKSAEKLAQTFANKTGKSWCFHQRKSRTCLVCDPIESEHFLEKI